MPKARHDKLIAALIAKLPAPTDGTAQWQQEDRITWLQMMAMAFDAVYGRCCSIAIAADVAQPVGANSAPSVPPPCPETEPRRPRRFYVDHDGFAISDGRPIGIDDLPSARRPVGRARRYRPRRRRGHPLARRRRLRGKASLRAWCSKWCTPPRERSRGGSSTRAVVEARDLRLAIGGSVFGRLR